MNERLLITLPYRSSSPHSLAVQEAVAEAMRPAITDSLNPEPARRATVAAGADEPERHPAHRLDSEQIVTPPDLDAANDDGVHEDEALREAERRSLPSGTEKPLLCLQRPARDPTRPRLRPSAPTALPTPTRSKPL